MTLKINETLRRKSYLRDPSLAQYLISSKQVLQLNQEFRGYFLKSRVATVLDYLISHDLEELVTINEKVEPTSVNWRSLSSSVKMSNELLTSKREIIPFLGKDIRIY